jgi:hypothetical protein
MQVISYKSYKSQEGESASYLCDGQTAIMSGKKSKRLADLGNKDGVADNRHAHYAIPDGGHPLGQGGEDLHDIREGLDASEGEKHWITTIPLEGTHSRSKRYNIQGWLTLLRSGESVVVEDGCEAVILWGLREE